MQNVNGFDKSMFIVYLIASVLSLIFMFSVIFEYKRAANKVQDEIKFHEYALNNVESLNKAITEEKSYE